MRIALCQVNTKVGDIEGNAALVTSWAARAAAAGADLAVFPEQTLSGYPAEDLLFERSFVAHCESRLAALAREVAIPTLVGFPEAAPPHDDETGPPPRYNSCALLQDGAVAVRYRKMHLPNYAVFDEKRYFSDGAEPLLVEVAGCRVGITICEDLWVSDSPARELAAQGAQVVVNLSASPYRLGRGTDRERLLQRVAGECGVPVLLCNQVGGQDELVFDGHSICVGANRAVVARGTQFDEDMVLVELTDNGELRHIDSDGSPAQSEVLLDECAEVYAALVLGLRDYVGKNGFDRVALGLSGGIDSALVLALAVDAFGADRVLAATMPSRFTSSGTLGDSHEMAGRLGVHLLELPIESVRDSFLSLLNPHFEGRGADLTEENLQARIRGTLLMALSNKLGHMVLATGNKSEMSVGYATLYGDMAGGLAPLKDVGKLRVYELSRWRNVQARLRGEVEPIPESVIERAPSAELAPDQKDTDSLPLYEVLDPLVELLVERDAGIDEVVARGFDRELVLRIRRMIDRAEYKRRQAPPGIRITSKAFGRDRRMPITNRYVRS